MKHRIIPINILLFITNIFSQGWQWQNPLPFGDRIEKVYFVDSQHGWILPQNPTLLRTTDSGQNWEIIYSEIISNDIFFVDPLEGWAIGDSTIEGATYSIYHTTDGGQNWEIQLADTTVRYDIFFLDRLRGWATGGGVPYGTLMHTSDGGQTWVRQAEQEFRITDEIHGVLFLDSLKGWAVGGLLYGIHTTDGGLTWERDSLLKGTKQLIYADSLHLWGYSGTQNIRRSTDGGASWQWIPFTDTTATASVMDLFALDTSRVFAATNLGVYASTDGGQNWFFHSEAVLESFFFPTPQEVWGGGDNIHAELLHSTDGGVTWMNLVTTNNPAGYETYRAVDFVDSQTGWIIGNYPNSIGSNFILKTIDGGLSWTFQQSNANPMLRNLTFVDDQYGWIVGQGGIIRHTSDGGQNWLPQISGTSFSLEAVSFINRRNGWAVGGAFTNNGVEGVIIHTSDGGQTWIDQTPGLITGLSGLSFVDSLTGWVVGGGGSAIDYGIILHTSNGGQSWIIQRQHYDLELYDVQFVDDIQGWTVGWDPITSSEIIYTNDGGSTWIGQTGVAGVPRDIKIVDSSNGWVVSLLGRIYHTTDAGQTWLLQSSYTNQGLNGIDFIDELNGWIVGHHGTILHTTTGGMTSISPWFRANPLPEKFILYPNYPNPFNPGTKIRFAIQSPRAKVRLSIFDILGRRIIKLFEGELFGGSHEFTWNGRDDSGREVVSGIYLYRLEVDGQTKTGKMLKLK